MPVIAGIAAGGQALGGLYQQYKAGRIRKKAEAEYNANPYQIPGSAIASVNKYAQLAQGNRMAGQDQMESNIQRNTAASVNAARQASTSPSQVLASTIASYNAQQQNQQNLDLAAAQNYQQRQQQYAGAIATLAPYEQKRWEFRTLYPYQAKMNQASGMQQQGQQNVQQGIQSGLSMYANDQYLKSLTPPTNGMPKMDSLQPNSFGGFQQPQQGLAYMGNYGTPPIQPIQFGGF